ncbi:hypothetical protein NEOLEDRAFT_35844 [Neolentinus lepideus HHB14362 ss-1]|uniref:Uncharacterized protein n=1 Tax=Neolentinus lepideus HHB14362 ss-1 TaxID=1314782 RepID=A0A165W7D7_9AGAM|nr:hypothetical protein NEOLEDRAFT_35844 [Neolentinus lepideus HHB14362 ss-1]
MEGPQKRKIMSKVEYPRSTSRNGNISRPASPNKYLAQPPPSPGPSNLLRPKAKVNSSASLRPRKLSTTASTLSSAGRVNSAPPPRSTSPFKQSQGAVSPPQRAPQARITARPISKSVAASPNVSPDSRRSPATTRLDQVGSPGVRRRVGSLSLQRSLTPPALGINGPASPSTLTSEPPGISETLDSLLVSHVRVRSKVSDTLKSSLATSPQSNSSSISTSPPYATTRPIRTRSRPPSLSSIGLDSPPSHASPTVYPITTCAPSANPHRYSPPRPPQHLPIPEGTYHRKANSEANIALPHSPPASAVSFSSKSSTSQSSASQRTRNSSGTLPTSTSRVGLGILEEDKNGVPSGHSSREPSYEDDVSNHDSSEGSDDYDSEDISSDDPDRQHKLEAKSNRMIADLEITNRSLMSINSTLEATKNKQAKEIRELRRKLRESMLILPPRTFQAVKSTLAEDIDKVGSVEEEEAEEDEEEEDEDKNDDPAFERVKAMVEGLLQVGKRALETKPEDFAERTRGGTKVLTAEEVQSWQNRRGNGESEDPDTSMSQVATEGETSFDSSAPSSSYLRVPDVDDESTSEEEVEALMSEPVLLHQAPIPPITISTS